MLPLQIQFCQLGDTIVTCIGRSSCHAHASVHDCTLIVCVTMTLLYCTQWCKQNSYVQVRETSAGDLPPHARPFVSLLASAGVVRNSMDIFCLVLAAFFFASRRSR